MARWEDALDAQLELVQRMRSNEYLRNVTRGFFEIEREKARLRFSQHDIETMPDRLAIMAYNADPVYVDPDMQTLWEGTNESFSPEPLMPSDLISPAGFIWLPRPFYSLDVNNKVTTTRAIMWHPQGVVMHFEGQTDKAAEYMDKRFAGKVAFDQDEDDDKKMSMPVKRLSESDYETTGILLTLLHYTPDKDAFSDPMEPHGLFVQHVYPWTFGQQWGTVDRPISDSILAFQSLWRLMQEKIVRRTTEDPDRHTRKRLQRAEWPARRITVIRLRRTEEPREKPDEPNEVNWTHRWIVEPYWRRQLVGPKDNQHYRNILVTGHIKGPKDLPLVARKTRVFSWTQ